MFQAFINMIIKMIKTFFGFTHWVSGYLLSCRHSCMAPFYVGFFFFFWSFLGIHRKTGDWYSWYSGQLTTKACRMEDAASFEHGVAGRFERLSNLLLRPLQRQKSLPLFLIFSFSCGLKKNSQVSQADRRAAIPWLHSAECVAGIQIFFLPLTCFVLFYFSLFKHWETSLHRNEPTRRVSPGTENYAASYWSDVSTILCSTYYTDTHAHWDTHMLRKNNPHTRSMRCTHKHKWRHGSFETGREIRAMWLFVVSEGEQTDTIMDMDSITDTLGS